MAGKPLVTDTHVREALRQGAQHLTVAPGTLITPLARDTARAKGLSFVEATPQVPHPPAATNAPRRLIIGSDHGGFMLKEALKGYLTTLGWAYEDVGTHSESACDYPHFARLVAEGVRDRRALFGLMIDGAGLGSAMVCNKVTGVRAACAYNHFTAWNARAHNNANVLTLGSRTLGIEVCKSVLSTFLTTDFEGGRHERRVDQINALDGS